MALRAAVFDLDGTLVDTEAVWTVAMTRWLAFHGATYDIAIQKILMGKPALVNVKWLQDRFGIAGDAEALVVEREQFFRKALLETGFIEKPGACRFIQELHAAGVKIALATSADRDYAENALQAIACRGCFSAVVCGEDVKHGKPAPDIYLKAVEALSVSPNEAVAFEDAPSGIQSANAAGLVTVGMVDPRYMDALSEAKLEARHFDELSVVRLQSLFS